MAFGVSQTQNDRQTLKAKTQLADESGEEIKYASGETGRKISSAERYSFQTTRPATTWNTGHNYS